MLGVYVEHYNAEPHGALGLRPPTPFSAVTETTAAEIGRRDKLGGLLHECYRAAA